MADAELAALQADFVAGVRQISPGMGDIVDSQPLHVRAWPVCLRPLAVTGHHTGWGLAVAHVRRLVCTLHVLPRTAQLAESATGRSGPRGASATPRPAAGDVGGGGGGLAVAGAHVHHPRR